MKIVSWNINSVRLRLGLIEKLTNEENPDILCLQETKVVNDLFPIDDLKKIGFEYQVFSGQKSYNGVAILSKFPITLVENFDVSSSGDARHVCVNVDNKIELHNFYIPAGGDEPDVNLNPKYKYKLEYVEFMTKWFKKNRTKNDKIVILGDFNIAPFEHDVWSHKQLKNVISHTEPEITRILDLQGSLNWIDVGRKFIPMTEKLYSWWSYRNRDWKKSNRGRRLDHIWTTPSLKDSLISYSTITHARDWIKPSDHVPICIDLDF